LLRLEAVLPPHRARIDGLAGRLRLSRAEAARLTAWVDAPEPDPEMDDAQLAQILYRTGRDGFQDRLRHALARELDKGNADGAAQLRRLIAGTARWEKPLLPVNGQDLMRAGLEPGPAVGKRLRELEAAWVESGFALTREELLAQIDGA
jgi:tRNA nucleotidyltransferase/poly(A) polymerase